MDYLLDEDGDDEDGGVRAEGSLSREASNIVDLEDDDWFGYLLMFMYVVDFMLCVVDFMLYVIDLVKCYCC